MKKSAQRRRKHCALALVRQTHKQTNKQTNTQTGAITIHCAAASLVRNVIIALVFLLTKALIYLQLSCLAASRV